MSLRLGCVRITPSGEGPDHSPAVRRQLVSPLCIFCCCVILVSCTTTSCFSRLLMYMLVLLLCVPRPLSLSLSPSLPSSLPPSPPPLSLSYPQPRGKNIIVKAQWLVELPFSLLRWITVPPCNHVSCCITKIFPL